MDLQSAQPKESNSLLRHADFVKLWTGEAISEFGSKLGGVAMSFLAVISLGATPIQMGILHAFWTAPALLFSLFAGVWVDRLRRRPLMIAADLVNLAVLASIPIAAALGRLRIGQLYAVMFVTAFADTLFDVGYRAYLPSLVGRDSIARANSMLSATESVAEVGGFALAGWLVQWLTAPIAILIDSVSFIFSALFLSLIGKPEEAPARRDRRGVAGDIVEGARFLLDDPRLLAIALSAAMASIANGIMSALYMLYFVNQLGFAPGPLGMIFATGGGAALIGAAFAPRIADRIGIWPAMALGLAGMGAGYGLITLAHGAGPSSVALLVAQQLLGDSAGTVYFVLSTTLLQRIAPQHIIGRVVAGMKFLGLAAFLLASLGGGFLGQAIGFRASLVIAAVALMAGAAIAAPMREGTAAERAAV